MKACSIFVFAVAFLALGYADVEQENKFHEKLVKLRAKCGDKDAEITPFSLCMHIELGVQNSNGDIDKSNLKTLLGKNTKLNAETVDKVVAECGERNGATAGDAAEALDHCMEKHLSIPGTIYTRSSKHD